MQQLTEGGGHWLGRQGRSGCHDQLEWHHRRPSARCTSLIADQGHDAPRRALASCSSLLSAHYLLRMPLARRRVLACWTSLKLTATYHLAPTAWSRAQKPLSESAQAPALPVQHPLPATKANENAPSASSACAPCKRSAPSTERPLDGLCRAGSRKRRGRCLLLDLVPLAADPPARPISPAPLAAADPSETRDKDKWREHGMAAGMASAWRGLRPASLLQQLLLRPRLHLPPSPPPLTARAHTAAHAV